MRHGPMVRQDASMTAPHPRPRRVSRHLDVAAPYAAGAMLGWLGRRAISGIEVVDGTHYGRSVRLAGGPATVTLEVGADHVTARVDGASSVDTDAAIAICRRVLDLDGDPAAVAATLQRDPVLAPLVARTPGLRLPGAGDPDELAVRAVLGQQVSLAAARTLGARLVTIAGERLPVAGDAITHTFPTSDRILEVDLTRLGMPGARRRALRELCLRLADGRVVLDGARDHDDVRARLLEVPGVGPWTAGYIVLRGLHDPDVFLPGDVAIRRAAAKLGLPATEAGLRAHAQRWRPWRSYAMQHLWHSLA